LVIVTVLDIKHSGNVFNLGAKLILQHLSTDYTGIILHTSKWRHFTCMNEATGQSESLAE